MKKKIFYWIIIAIILLGIGGAIGYNIAYNNSTNTEEDTQDSISLNTVEDFINADKISMDSIAGEYIFFESRVELCKPFNESDSAEIEEVTNVFQTNVADGNDIITTVYMFVHNIQHGETDIEIYDNAFITDDIELNTDSVLIPFVDAFTLARQSNYAPSKSKYITLRHGFGRYKCNPFYTIGNTESGHLWVDAITGEVTDIDPATQEK